MVRRTGTRALLLALVAVFAASAAYAQQDASARSREESRREEWQKVDEIFEAMGVKPGAVVADVGAGGGFFTTRLARAVGEQGRVYAVDISANSLKRLRARVEADKLQNVETVQSEADDPKLPAGSLDAVLIVNAYHEFKEHQAMLAKIRTALKPTGRLVLVEPISPRRRNETREAQARQHEIAAAFVREDALQAGFVVTDLKDPFTTRHAGSDEEWLMVLTPATREGGSHVSDDHGGAGGGARSHDGGRGGPKR